MNSKQYNLIKSAYINKQANPSWLDYYRAYQQLGDHLALGTNPKDTNLLINIARPKGMSGAPFETVLENAVKSDKLPAPTVRVNNAPHTWASRGRQVGAIGMHGLGLGLGAAGGYGLTNAATKALGMHDSDSGFVRGLGTVLNLGGLAAGAYLGHGLGRYASGRLMSGASKNAVKDFLPKLNYKPKYDTINNKLYKDDLVFAELGGLIKRW